MKESARKRAGIALGFLWLHALCALRFPWENVPLYASWLRVSLDLTAYVGIGLLVRALFTRGGRCAGWGSRIGLVHVLAGLTLLLVLFRFAYTLMPVFFGREVDLYNDIDMFPGLVHLLLHRQGLVLQVLGIVVALLLGALVYWATQRAWCTVLDTLGGDSTGKVLASLGFLTLVGVVDLQTNDESYFVTSYLSDDVASACSEIVASHRELARYADQLDAARLRLEGVATDLDHIRGTDVFILFIESYGRCLFRDPELRGQLETWSGPWLQRLESAGYSMRTAFAFPSVRGGNSSMAHAEFMSGVPTWTRRSFDRLLASDLRSLPDFFREAGYRTFNVQPAMPRAWKEGKFFGFTDDIFQADFPYAGTAYHWGTMPDQYALAYLLQEYIIGSDKPVFVQFVSVTSHAPFSMIPPYIEDWERAAEGAAFAGPPAHDYGIGWLEYVGHPRLAEAYLASIRYSLDTAFQFIAQLERDALVLVLGDHQPPRIGAFQELDQSFDVPIHVIARDQRALAAFEPFGFQDGFLPATTTGNFSTSRILTSFLESFSSGEEQTR